MDQVRSDRYSAYDRMEVWDSMGRGSIRFHASEIGEPNLGYIVENNALLEALADKVRTLDAVHLMPRKSVKSIDTQSVDLAKENRDWAARLMAANPSSSSSASSSAASSLNQIDRAVVKLDSGEALTARLVVGSDGARSRVRDMMCMPWVGWDYKQRAVVATIATNLQNNTAFQRFLPTGPIAMLPVN